MSKANATFSPCPLHVYDMLHFLHGVSKCKCGGHPCCHSHRTPVFAAHPLHCCMKRTIAHDITHDEFEPRALKKPNWLGEGDFLSIPRPEKRPPLYMLDHFTKFRSSLEHCVTLCCYFSRVSQFSNSVSPWLVPLSNLAHCPYCKSYSIDKLIFRTCPSFI